MTKAESRYIGAAVALGCALCRRLRGCISPAEYHHKRSGTGAGRKATNYEGFPLCPHDHRLSNDAIHVLGRKAWERKYHVTEEELVAETRDELAYLIPEGA